MHSKTLYLTLLSAALTLVACSPKNMQQQPTIQGAAKSKYLTTIQNWKARGKIGVYNKQQATNASVDWQQQQDRFNVYIYGPLNSGSVTISGDQRQVKLVSSDGKELQARTPEELARNSLGWHMPISGLRYWLLGIANPHSKTNKIETDHRGNITYLEQDGWRITYRKYTTYRQVELPERVFLENPGLTLKFSFYEWNLNN